jgi:non-canonical poly(A) RNA polymerase PAPD5/7
VVSTKLLTQSNKQRLLAELARAMKTRRITDTVAIIGKARVPIIKFVTYEGKINVDISLNQTNGISAGRIINRFLTALPGSRQLIVVVKAFLSQRSMNEVFTGGLGSYAVICLVISFLQVHPKLRRCELDPEQNLGTLLIEFFELYGRNFNYDAVGVSIRQGGFYFDKDRRGWTRPGQRYLLSLEDPQDAGERIIILVLEVLLTWPDNDITTGSFGIRQVRATFSGAYEMLQAKLFERAEQISGKKSGRYTAAWDPEEMSILTAIMGVTKEVRQSILPVWSDTDQEVL